MMPGNSFRALKARKKTVGSNKKLEGGAEAVTKDTRMNRFLLCFVLLCVFLGVQKNEAKVW